MSVNTVKIWDLPTRLFHWLLVATIMFQYISVEFLDDAIQWHFYGGYFCIGLILFRIIWGMVGSYYARFSQFVVSPVSAFKYLFSHQQSKHLGHNPAGAYSVILLLSLVFTQAITGLFLSDDIFTEAPYYDVLPGDWQDLANFLHHNVINVLLGAIALHIFAISFYKIKHKQHLTTAMLTGQKELTKDIKRPVNVNTNWWLFIICVVAVIISVYVLIEVLPPAPENDYFY